MIRKLSQKPTNTSRTMNVTYSLFSEVKNDPFGKLPRLFDAMPQPSHGSFDEMPRPFTRATIWPTRHKHARRSATAALPTATTVLKTTASALRGKPHPERLAARAYRRKV